MATKQRKSRPPLDGAGLQELAISYVGRFATSKAKLRTYLARKLRERGWAGDGEPPVEALADRLAGLGYVDDRAFALAKAKMLTARGYGGRRVDQALRQSGIEEDDGQDARRLARSEAVTAALRFAAKKSIGPFAAGSMDRQSRERAIATMVRAGHEFGLARAIAYLQPGDDLDEDRFPSLD